MRRHAASTKWLQLGKESTKLNIAAGASMTTRGPKNHLFLQIRGIDCIGHNASGQGEQGHHIKHQQESIIEPIPGQSQTSFACPSDLVTFGQMFAKGRAIPRVTFEGCLALLKHLSTDNPTNRGALGGLTSSREMDELSIPSPYRLFYS
jgi:hypothetical protein